MKLIIVTSMRRRTVSLSEIAADAIERIARERHTTPSGVVEAAGLLLHDDPAAAEELIVRIVPDRRGGRREGAGRKTAKAS